MTTAFMIGISNLGLFLAAWRIRGQEAGMRDIPPRPRLLQTSS
jgi:hypothetical protein